MLTRRTMLSSVVPAAVAARTPVAVAACDPDRIIADLIGRFPSKWMAVVHIAQDLILELECACDDAPPGAAEAEALYEREKPRLRMLCDWASEMERGAR